VRFSNYKKSNMYMTNNVVQQSTHGEWCVCMYVYGFSPFDVFQMAQLRVSYSYGMMRSIDVNAIDRALQVYPRRTHP